MNDQVDESIVVTGMQSFGVVGMPVVIGQCIEVGYLHRGPFLSQALVLVRGGFVLLPSFGDIRLEPLVIR